MSEFDLAAFENSVSEGNLETLDLQSNRNGSVVLRVRARDGRELNFTHVGAWWWLAVGDEFLLIQDTRLCQELTDRAVMPQVSFYWFPGSRTLVASWCTIRRAASFFHRSRRVKARFRLHRKDAILQQFQNITWSADEIHAAVELLRESGMAR